MNRHRNFTASTLTVGLGLALAAPLAHAAVFDTFETGVANNDNLGTRGDDTGDASDVPFFANQPANKVNPELSVVTNNTINPDDGNGNQALLVDVDNTSQGSSTRVGTVVAPLGETFTLANTGDTLSLSFKFLKQTTNGGVGSIFALLNDGGTPATADSALNTSDDFGYGLNIGNPTGNGAGTSAAGEVAAGGTVLNFDGGSTNTTTGFKNDTSTVQDVTLLLTRTATGVQVDGSFTESNSGSTTTLGSFLDTASPTFSFNTFAFSQGTSAIANDFLLDDVQVTFTPIPEPASLALVGLGSLLILGGRRQ